MRIAGARVMVNPGALGEVVAKLGPIDDVEIVDNTDDAVAIIIEAPTPKDQERRHKEIADWPEVSDVALVFQTGEV